MSTVDVSNHSVLYLLGDMSESKAHHIEIRDVDGQMLLKLVDYIYTAEVEVSEENVQVSQNMNCLSVQVCL